MAFKACARVDLPFEVLGEARWHGQIMPLESLASMVDADSFLEEGELLEEFVAGDDTAHAWHGMIAGESVLALETHGWTFIFTEGGRHPDVDLVDTAFDHADPVMSEVMSNKLASVLAPVNSAYLGRMFADNIGEGEVVVSQTERVIHSAMPNGLQRVVVLDDAGCPVSGLTFREGVVDIAYTLNSMRYQGYGKMAFNAASEIMPGLQHSDVLTEDGQKFAARTPAREAVEPEF